jgi:hypothetical protein
MSRPLYCGLTLLFILIMIFVILLSSPMFETNSGNLASAGKTARRATISEGLVPNPKARLKEQFHELAACELTLEFAPALASLKANGAG